MRGCSFNVKLSYSNWFSIFELSTENVGQTLFNKSDYIYLHYDFIQNNHFSLTFVICNKIRVCILIVLYV